MKTLISSLLAITILLAIPGMALAKGDKPFSGKVTAVDAAAGTITIAKHKSGESKTFKTAGAMVTVDGASGKLSDITVGMHAKVTAGSSPDTASSIAAKTARKHGKKGSPSSSPSAVASPTP